MISIKNKIKSFSVAIGIAVISIVACNKAPEQIGPNPVAPIPSGARALGDTLSKIANDTMFYKVLARAGKLTLLNDKTKSFTIFAPDNNAIKSFITAASGGLIPAGSPDATFVGFINAVLRPGQADTLVSYHIIPQSVPTAGIPNTFPNFPYPTIFNPASTASALARLDAYISRRTNGAWKNNIPVIVPDIIAANGVIHTIAAVSIPPSTLLWDRINTDANLTYLKAAIQRADVGAPADLSLQYLLGTQAIAIGLNITLFAPTDDAMKNFIIGAIAQALILQGVPPATAQTSAQTLVASYGTTLLSDPASIPVYGPQLAAVFTPTTAKGIVAYHLLFGQRAFTPNIPSTATTIPTFLNSGIPSHPGVTISATFTGPVVSSATVKGLLNSTASNLILNPLPGGSSDQHYVNGVLHKIDQVLRPQ